MVNKGQKQSLEVLEELQSRIASKLRQLLRKRLLEAEASLLEELKKKALPGSALAYANSPSF
jgi:hypothetical protein